MELQRQLRQLIYILIFLPIVYDLISDFFHYIVFRFIAPTVWNRAHIYDRDGFSQLAVPEAATPAAPTLAPMPEYGPVDQKTVEIGSVIVPAAEILRLESLGNDLRVVTQSEESLVRFRISAAVEMLGDDMGVFLHRSRWAAYTGMVKAVQTGSQWRVHMRNGAVIGVASTREEDVLAALVLRGIPVRR